MFKLNNTVQEYKWGMTDWLPRFLYKENPLGSPWAELWMGAHPKAPSMSENGEALDKLISEKGEDLLGENTYRRYGRLPFLFKILAVKEPLSIQVHPSLEQAREGYARENREGIDITAFNRNYRDDNHKPEIICAVEPYTAMKGFRSYEDIVMNFNPLSRVIKKDLFGGKNHESFFFSLMELSEEEKTALLEKAAGHKGDDLKWGWVKKLMAFYPGDISALAPLFLNIVELKPGEALFLPAGEMHAYLSGVGIELMANSDNVLRGGLTPKHVDLAELKKIVNFAASPVNILNKGIDDLYPSFADEFVLGEKIIKASYILNTEGEAAVILVFSGSLKVKRGDDWRTLVAGEVLFTEAGGNLELEGDCKIFWARAKTANT